MGFSSRDDLVYKVSSLGQFLRRDNAKITSPVATAGGWHSLFGYAGYPNASTFPSAQDLVFQACTETGGDAASATILGIQHGGNVAPESKYVRRVMAMNVTAAGVPQRLYLLDYLGFYPFVDMGTADAQTLTNTQSLTRYTDGEGVQIMAVLVAPHSLVGDTFTVTYTNQDGTADRVTPAHTMTTAVAVNGTILTTQTAGAGRFGPFLTLAAGDTGVRSVQSVQCAAGTDVGLFTLVLVKPLCEFTIRGIDAPVEIDYLTDAGMKVPQVVDDAYLNFIACPNGSLSGAALNGDITFVWD